MPVRQPRCWLLINGARVPCIEAGVTRKSRREADTFHAELAIKVTALFGMGLAEWADYQPTQVEVLMSTDSAGNAVSMITGEIDAPHIHWNENTVSVSGRDLSSKLIEKRVSKAFKNRKTADIVSEIASDVGLASSVVGTSGFAGKLVEQDTVHLALNKTYFEILSDLADREAARWYVEGATLYFEPKEQGADVYSAFWGAPGAVAPFGVATLTDLETFRNMTAARPHEVAVRSWHHRDKKQYTGLATAGGTGRSVEFEHHHNGRNQDQVDRLSKSRLRDAIRHDCNVVAKAPGDLSVSPRMKFALTTAPTTIYSQQYDIDSVTFDMGWKAAFTMDIEAKAAKAGRDPDSGLGASSAPMGQGGIGHA